MRVQAQATSTDRWAWRGGALLLVGVLTSRGASGVTGAGCVTRAAALAGVPAVPVGALALILGIDKFMSECRALTNLVGNGVATIVISRWEGELDRDRLNAALAGATPAAASLPDLPVGADALRQAPVQDG